MQKNAPTWINTYRNIQNTTHTNTTHVLRSIPIHISCDNFPTNSDSPPSSTSQLIRYDFANTKFHKQQLFFTSECYIYYNIYVFLNYLTSTKLCCHFCQVPIFLKCVTGEVFIIVLLIPFFYKPWGILQSSVMFMSTHVTVGAQVRLPQSVPQWHFFFLSSMAFCLF